MKFKLDIYLPDFLVRWLFPKTHAKANLYGVGQFSKQIDGGLIGGDVHIKVEKPK